jgi:hypothetical protein
MRPPLNDTLGTEGEMQVQVEGVVHADPDPVKEYVGVVVFAVIDWKSHSTCETIDPHTNNRRKNSINPYQTKIRQI